MALRFFAIAVAAVLLTAQAAWAKPGVSKRETEEHACYGDAMSLCGEFVPDEAKITACMEQKRDRLSPACAALFEK